MVQGKIIILLDGMEKRKINALLSVFWENMLIFSSDTKGKWKANHFPRKTYILYKNPLISPQIVKLEFNLSNHSIEWLCKGLIKTNGSERSRFLPIEKITEWRAFLSEES